MNRHLKNVSPPSTEIYENGPIFSNPSLKKTIQNGFKLLPLYFFSRQKNVSNGFHEVLGVQVNGNILFQVKEAATTIHCWLKENCQRMRPIPQCRDCREDL